MQMLSRGDLNTIAVHVCQARSIDPKDLIGPNRARFYSVPRQEFFYLAKELTKKSLTQIGNFTGKRDHTTVMHGVRQTSSRMGLEPEYQAEIEEMRMQISMKLNPQFIRRSSIEFKSVRGATEGK